MVVSGAVIGAQGFTSTLIVEEYLCECGCSVGIRTLAERNRSRSCLNWTTQGWCERGPLKLLCHFQSGWADVMGRHTGGSIGATVIQFKWASPPSSCEKLWFTVFFFFFPKPHLSAYTTPCLLFTADIVSLSITPRPCLDPTTQWVAAPAPAFFYLLPVSISPSA